MAKKVGAPNNFDILNENFDPRSVHMDSRSLQDTINGLVQKLYLERNKIDPIKKLFLASDV